jgi:hypothetical protein
VRRFRCAEFSPRNASRHLADTRRPPARTTRGQPDPVWRRCRGPPVLVLLVQPDEACNTRACSKQTVTGRRFRLANATSIPAKRRLERTRHDLSAMSIDHADSRFRGRPPFAPLALAAAAFALDRRRPPLLPRRRLLWTKEAAVLGTGENGNRRGWPRSGVNAGPQSGENRWPPIARKRGLPIG